MNEREIDDLLKRAADRAPGVDPALLDRVAGSLRPSTQAVRPLPAPWLLIAGLLAATGVVAAAGAVILGPYGIRKMEALEICLIFPVLGLLSWISAALSVAEAIPGSRRPVAPWVLSVCGCIALAALFAALVPDHRTDHFVAQGTKCLRAGLIFAVPAALAAWCILNRGFAVNSVSSGLAKGTLAGLAGVAMLELHCPLFTAPHVMVWHVAVMAVAGAIGALMGRWRQRYN